MAAVSQLFVLYRTKAALAAPFAKDGFFVRLWDKQAISVSHLGLKQNKLQNEIFVQNMSANEQVHYTKIFLKQPLKMLRPPPLHVVTVAQHFQFIYFNHDSTFLFLFSLFLGRFLFPQSLLLLIFINLPAPPFLALQWRDTCIKNNARKKKKTRTN